MITTLSCGHCKKAVKLLSEARLNYQVLDVSKPVNLIRQHHIRGVPYFLIYDNQKLIDKWRGLEPLFIYTQNHKGGTKMKELKFKANCTDKNTKELYNKGDIVSFPDERADEIIASGYAEEHVAEKRVEVEEGAVLRPIEEAEAETVEAETVEAEAETVEAETVEAEAVEEAKPKKSSKTPQKKRGSNKRK